MSYYLGDYRTDATSSRHHGWIIGSFIEDDSPRKTDAVEVKYWEFESGPTTHETKVSAIYECTFFLAGSATVMVDGKQFDVAAGNYLAIPPGVPNNLAVYVHEAMKGITIKAPSDPHAKKVLK